MGEVIGGNPYRAIQKRKPRRDSWTKTKRTAFLIELEASCNVRMACAAAGIGKDAAYGLRRRDPVFAAAWSEALDLGCENIRALLMARALGATDADLIDANPDADDIDAAGRPAAMLAPMSDEMRLKVLQVCRAASEGRQGRAVWRKPPAFARTADDAFRSLAAKLDRVEKKLKADGKA